MRFRTANGKKFSILAVTALATALLVVANSVRSDVSGPPEFDAKHIVRFNGVEVGTSLRSFRKRDDGLLVLGHHLQVGKLMQLFGTDPMVQVSTMRVYSNGELEPIKYTFSEILKEETSVDAVFDWDSRRLLIDGEKDYAFPEVDEIQDWESWFLSFMYQPNERSEGRRVGIAELDETDVYRYAQSQRASLDTAVGRLETIQMTMFRENRSGRKLVVWIAPELHGLPVKIEWHRKNRVLEISLAAVEWLE